MEGRAWSRGVGDRSKIETNLDRTYVGPSLHTEFRTRGESDRSTRELKTEGEFNIVFQVKGKYFV